MRSLSLADPPEVWRELGFAVDGNRCSVDGIVQVLTGSEQAGRGIRSWALDGLAIPDDGQIDGLLTASGGVSGGGATGAGASGGVGPAGGAAGVHPNGVTGIDHLVVATPDLDRTVRAFEAAGLDVRRTREGEAYGHAMHQAFFKLGPVVLEVVGPPSPMGDGHAGFFGIAYTVADLEATAALLGSRLHPAKEAVQPGRQIATLDKGAGSSAAIAFMSPGPAEYS